MCVWKIELGFLTWAVINPRQAIYTLNFSKNGLAKFQFFNMCTIAAP